MDIIQRNLFRLLRSGTFGAQEQIEPMSAFKWERLYQIAMLHDVIPYAYQGITNCRSQRRDRCPPDGGRGRHFPAC